MHKLLFTALFCLLPVFGHAQEKSRTILVLDASGSMWGQIDGKAKISIAQDVIGDLLQSLPADQELGLTVYGHRRKGDCSDIETMILPGGDTRGAISTAVNAITPKGKTPLSAAVIQAAEALKYTEERATVILVSDGRETCELDPCEVGRNLESAGIDFTAHVIGFDISSAKDRAELQCLAEETGGTFRTASNADELNEALQVIAEPDPIPVPVKVTFRAIEGENGPLIETPLIWTLTHADNSLIDNAPHDNNFSMDMLAGSGHVDAMRPADEASVQAEFSVDSDSMTVTLVLPQLLPAATLTAPDTAAAGSNIAVGWDAPEGKNDYITVAEIGSGGSRSVGYAYTEDSNPLALRMPLQPGQYELRYILGLGSKILAQRLITITPVTASLSPPAQINAGSLFTLDWTGPGYKNDYISMAKPGSKATRYETYAYTQKGSPMQLRAPTTPGSYLLRYIASGADAMALASMEVDVVAVSATLDSIDTVPAGSELAVNWTGPNSKNDYVAINEVGDDLRGELSYAYTQNSDGKALSLKVPTTPGTYELRYIQNGKPKAMLTSKLITVIGVTASLISKDTVPAGGKIAVTWTGPDSKNDYIAINEVGADLKGELSYAYTQNSDGDTILLQLPTTAGIYELRYIQNGKPKTMLASKVITITAVTATLQADTTAPAGSQLLVTWTGPASKNDYIAINDQGDDLKGELSYVYVQNSDGNKIWIDMPLTAGTYELRYIQNGKPKAMLTSRPITAVAVQARLNAKPSAAPGANLVVEWSGPDYKNDRIAISRVGDKRISTYAYTRDGSPLIIKVPVDVGDYELLYVMGSGDQVLLRLPLQVQ